MKHFLSIIILISFGFTGLAQNPIPVAFDESVDMMAVIWHLAGAREYNQCDITPYVESVDTYFASAKEHKAVKLASKYYREGTGFDAVAEYGSYLDITDEGNVVFDKNLIRDFDNRWSEEHQQEFLEAADAFYRDTRFHEWFVGTEEVRKEAVEAFSTISGMIDQQWYKSFFNAEVSAEFRITLCLMAGRNNFGLSAMTVDGLHKLFPVISSAHYADGKIGYDMNRVFPILVHEFCHAYCNPEIDKTFDQMADNANAVFALNKDLLSSQAYTKAKIMMYETYVRASVIKYLKEHFGENQINAEALIKEEESLGFLLTRTLLDSFGQGVSLVDAVNSFDVKKYVEDKALEESKRITYVCNIKDGQKNVPAGDFDFTITFDRPMGPGVSVNRTKEELPDVKGFSWSEDKKTFTLNLSLESGKTYGLNISGDHFIGEDGARAKESTIVFETKK